MALTLVPPGARKNRFWLARGRTPHGVVSVSTGCIDRREAQAWLRLHAAEIYAEAAAKQAVKTAAAATPAPAADGVRRFAEAVEGYAAQRHIDLSRSVTLPRGVSGASMRWHDQRTPAQRDETRRLLRLRAALGDKPLTEVVWDDLVRLGRSALPGRTNATINREIVTPARAVLHYAAKNRWCHAPQLALLKTPKPGLRCISPEGEARLLAGTNVFKERLLLLWLFRTGMRIEDTLQRVCWDDPARPGERLGIDLKSRVVRTRIGKTQEVGEFELADELVAALSTIAPAERCGKLFSWGNQQNVNRWLHPLRTRVGVHFTPHMARHTVGARLANNGAALATSMAVLGHRTAASSLRYQGISKSTVRAAVNALAPAATDAGAAVA